MKRQFFSSNHQCENGCLYCFAKWKNDYKKTTLFNYELIDDDSDVLYPSCDGEILNDSAYVENLFSIINKRKRKTIISISTKNDIDIDILDSLSNKNNEMIKENKGFIKISIPLVCKERINEIEPGTIKYEDRIGLLKRLKERNIPNSVVLKPLLPFIDLDVYKVIVDQTSIYTNSYLIGDLYVNIKSKFYEYYVKDKYEIHKREVLWLPDKKTWYVVVDANKRFSICNHITSIGCKCYNSDLDLIADLYESISNNV